MISFKQYLTEEVEAAEDYILAHCKSYLDELRIGPDEIFENELFRGIDTSGISTKIVLDIDSRKVTCLIKSVRKDRHPLDMHPELSKIIDDTFEEKFGWRPRSQGLFVYGMNGASDAKRYGMLHQIIPIGEFKYLWSPKERDLFGGAVMGIMRDMKLPVVKTGHYSTEQLQDFIDKIKSLPNMYRDTGLRKVVHTHRSEIMIDCKQYLAIPHR